MLAKEFGARRRDVDEEDTMSNRAGILGSEQMAAMTVLCDRSTRFDGVEEVGLDAKLARQNIGFHFSLSQYSCVLAYRLSSITQTS